MNIGNHSYRQLVEVNAVKSKIFIVHRIQGSSHHPSLDFVLFLGKQLELDIGIAGFGGGILSGQIFATVDLFLLNVFNF